ncbi:uncharacterized protein EV154DRAFT_537066 [Mucor mucedo]|uniref:uncharacterized protein n=1 Tax=Mucor mucedo TaxID=29922 RepID=UPI00221F745E|nr:uncharacterized protein EV154DRAFT_537066 [Mucor mucedo]KAI7893369.1 hypothetical protein EV154DRAFT_537066 [Mucor mucedo]
MIRKLDLSFNYLTELPEEIACLQHLEQLNVSHNQIEFLPDTIGQLSRLVELNVSHNRLETLATTTVDQLSKLQTFNVSQNKLKELRLTSIHVNSLTSIDLSYNPIAILPAEITQLPFLRRLRLEGCPLTTTLDDFPLAHDAPSLVEICARIIVKTRQPLKGLPQTMESYLKRGKTCSHCGGPYFESYVSRGRWIDRNDIWIPLEYRLCSAHWANESDRIYTMFSQSLLKPLEEDDCEPVKKWKHKVKSSLLKKLV